MADRGARQPSAETTGEAYRDDNNQPVNVERSVTPWWPRGRGSGYVARAATNENGDDMNEDTTPTELDLAYDAWGVIANVSEGDWSKQTQEWQDAAVSWRDRFHAALDAARA